MCAMTTAKKDATSATGTFPVAVGDTSGQSEVDAWFLRGINVGGAHRLPMEALRNHLAELGAEDVRTYIQSGNVVLRAPARIAAALPGRFEEEAPTRYGFAVPVMVRTAEELAAIIARNPFLAGQDPEGPLDHKRYHVGLLHTNFSGVAASALLGGSWAPDAVAIDGRHVYFDLPAGVSGSKVLTSKEFKAAWRDMTVRNWRTLTQVHDLARDLSGTR